MKKRILLLAPPYMDIYKDIIACLESKDYEVVWVSDGCISGNPYNKSNINRHTKTIVQYQSEVDAYWDNLFRTSEFVYPFDVFLAVDGFMVTPQLFKTLEDKNPNIKKVLYLYDRVEGNYEIDMFFPYYTSIYSFDIGDCEHFKLNHLPIYWVPSTDSVVEEYDVFGLAGFSFGARYDVYKSLKELCKTNELRDFIKLLYKPEKGKVMHYIKYLYYKVRRKQFLSPVDVKNDLFTTKGQSPKEFREMIMKSRVILDTQNSNQDGLTARFMWTLGAEKKIITTNKAASLYSFYTPEQVFILNENNIDKVVTFIHQDYSMPNTIRAIIKNYRIDNWIETMLCK